jgi:DNA processing protein
MNNLNINNDIDALIALSFLCDPGLPIVNSLLENMTPLDLLQYFQSVVNGTTNDEVFHEFRLARKSQSSNQEQSKKEQSKYGNSNSTKPNSNKNASKLIANQFIAMEKLIPTLNLDRIKLYLDRFDISIIPVPDTLKALQKEQPYLLFARGNQSLLTESKRISIVGTRSITAYGKHTVTEIASGLCERGFVTISGGAFGVDEVTHKSSIGRTIVVLPSSLSEPVPEGNFELFNTNLKKGGLLISETPPTKNFRAWSFLKRNRLVAAMSDNLLIGECPYRSGALNTFEWGLKLNKLIMSIPGNVTSPNSYGTNHIIQTREAEMVTNALDALNLIDIDTCSNSIDPANLTNEEHTIFEYIRKKKSVSVDEIATEVGKTLKEVIPIVSRLEELQLIKKDLIGYSIT